MKIVGISSHYHDSGVALIEDGKILFASQEERFSRIKHDSSFPTKALEAAVTNFQLTYDDIDVFVYYEKPFLKFERIFETFINTCPSSFFLFRKMLPIWLKQKLFLRSILRDNLKAIFPEFQNQKLKFSEHHLSHAASAFFPSPFENAAILTLDGVGEWPTTTISIGKNNSIERLYETNFPHSLGLFYSAITYHLGFKVNSGEYKVMGLAPYGEASYVDVLLGEVIHIYDDGSVWLNQKYFQYMTGLTMTGEKLSKLLGFERRNPEELLNQQHMDLAASVQQVIEIAILKTAKFARDTCGTENLCLAGGVALNCVANSKILENDVFANVWIQPAAGDAGGALGAALSYYFLENKRPRMIHRPDSMHGALLGIEFDNDSIRSELTRLSAVFVEYNDKELIAQTAKLITNGKTIGWFQGKAEFGPRALGSRSIIADPRDRTMQKNLNLKVKFRESFRPFAPAALPEDAKQNFNGKSFSPYMLLVNSIKRKHRIKTKQHSSSRLNEMLNLTRSHLPAVTHVDYSARLQVVNQQSNKRFKQLLTEFKNLTGIGVLINTSFNIRGEPIVNSPEDAFRCFMGTELDHLVIGNFILTKADQKVPTDFSYLDNFELD